MTTGELVARFPEIPADLHNEGSLGRFAEQFDVHLRTATKPSACSADWTPENRAYMKLIGPMDIYRYGLSSRARVLDQVGEMIAAHEASAQTFEDEMFEQVEKR